MRNMQSITQLLVFAALWVVCASQAASNATSSNATLNTLATSNTTTAPLASRSEKFRCNICGENGAIGNLKGVVNTQFGSLTCSALQGVGNAGAFTDEDCPTIQAQVAEDCACNTTAITTSGSPNSTTTPPAQSPAENLMPTSTGTTTTGNTTAAPFVCRICGEGMTVGRSAQLLQTPMGTSTCAVLAASGKVGKIAESNCSEIQELASASCQCIEGDAPTLPPFQSRSPAAPSSQQFRCPICGPGMMVTDPRGIVTVPSQTQRTCMQLVDLAMAGKIPVAQCVRLQQFSAPCGCEPTSPTLAPVPTASPSMTPSAIPSRSPSQMPLEPGQTRSPTSMPAVTFESCFTDLSDIHALERDLEDASIRRKYVLCPNTTFALGVVNDEGQIVDGQKMIHLRPNVIYQCGENGRRSNNCILQGGDFGVASFYGVFDGVSETVDKVVIRGLTFQSQQLFSVVLAAAGDVTFDDCAFQNHGGMAPIVLQWRGEGPDGSASSRIRELIQVQEEKFPNAAKNLYREQFESAKNTRSLKETDELRELQETNLKHVVTFKECVFKENSAVNELAFPGVIENTYLSELVVINSLFEKNDFSDTNNPAPFGYAIRSFGPLTIRSTCFIGNTFHNFAPVQAFGAVNASGNYGTTDQRDLSCQFIAGFETEEDFKKSAPKCVDYDLKTCAFKQFPTKPPVLAPSSTKPVAPKPVGSDNPGDSVEGPSSNAPSQYSFSSVLSVVVLVLAVSLL